MAHEYSKRFCICVQRDYLNFFHGFSEITNICILYENHEHRILFLSFAGFSFEYRLENEKKELRKLEKESSFLN